MSLVFDQHTFTFKEKKWADIKSGELIKIQKEEEFPCDIVLLKSDKESGIVFVDTMNLDGEVTNIIICETYYIDEFERKNVSQGHKLTRVSVD